MNPSYRTTVFSGLLLAIAFVGCGGPKAPLSPLPPLKTTTPPAASSSPSIAWKPTPDAPFRASAPSPTELKPWTAPVPEEAKLSNGMRILLVRRPSVPVIVVQVVSSRGADQQRIPGEGSMLGNMLEQGTERHSAVELSDAYSAIGASHGSWVSWDATHIWIQVLPQYLKKGLGLLSEVAMQPKFAPSEVDRVKQRMLARLKQVKDIPKLQLRYAEARALYPNHVYGVPLTGTPRDVQRISSNSLKALYRQLMVPKDMMIVVTGATTMNAVRPMIEEAFGHWKAAGPPRRSVPRVRKVSRRIVLLDHPGAAQSQVAVASIGVARQSSDHDAVVMANTILGGMFSSRLNMNLREKHAYTYGAYSYFAMRHGPGPFQAVAAIDTPKTVPALKEALKEMKLFCAEPVTEKERALAIGKLVKSLPGHFDTMANTAGAIANLGIYGLPNDYLATRADKLRQVTPKAILAAARKRLDPANMVVVIVGDRKRIEGDLKSLAFGPIQIIDDDGKTIETVNVPKPWMSLGCKASGK